MNSIDRTFERLRGAGQRGFIPFVTAGDPDLLSSRSIVEALAEEGADIVELGVPFSDPMADGPTIQASSQRALANRVSLADVLELVRQFRKLHSTPIVLFGYLNPILQYGVERFCCDAAESGVNGVLITDVVDDEAAKIRKLLAEKNIYLITLVAPTTSDERLETIARQAGGFIYAVSRAGVTGARANLSDAAETLVERVRKYTDLPVAVGFGISTREQIQATWRFADAAVVGSAIVAEIEMAGDAPDTASERVRQFVRRLLPRVAKTPTGI